MKRKWSYFIGAFFLTAGLLVGCAEESGQPLKETQAVEGQEPEQEKAPAGGTEESEAGEESAEAFEAPETLETAEVTEAPDDSLKTEILEDGVYTSKEEVAGYLFLYGHLRAL